MSGHSKWANIKHKKEKTDAQRGKIFTKIGREIAIAVREGGGADPEQNSRLRDVIAKAKAANMPNDNINRSIKKAAGEGDGANYVDLQYEGYAAGGVAVIVEVVTDNRNRTAGEMRHIFDKRGGSLGATGCVSWMFDRKGVLVIDREGLDEDEVMLQALEGHGFSFETAEIEMLPQNTVAVSDPDTVQKINLMLEMLDDHDDVQNVWHNAELPEEDE